MYLPQADSACNQLCRRRRKSEKELCCDPSATCSCGTHTGHYACLCPKGHYGQGFIGDCTRKIFNCSSFFKFLVEIVILVVLYKSKCKGSKYSDSLRQQEINTFYVIKKLLQKGLSCKLLFSLVTYAMLLHLQRHWNKLFRERNLYKLFLIECFLYSNAVYYSLSRGKLQTHS